MDKETIIKACENWVNYHKNEDLLLDYSSVIELLDVLKEQQEAVEPIEVFRKDTNCHEYHCKRCGNKVGTILGGKHPILPGVKLSIEHFCDVCGQAVKWK